MDAQTTNWSVEQVLGVLRRGARLICICCLLAAAAAFVFSKVQTTKYTATSSLVFTNNQQAALAGLPIGTVNQAAEENTNVALVKLVEVAEDTAQVLGGRLAKSAIKKAVSVSGQGESNIVNVAATSTSPELAATIANTYASQFVAVQKRATAEYYGAALAVVNKQLAVSGSLALRERAASLKLLAELPPNVRVAQVATIPTSPSSPKTKRNAALGAFLGLLLGVGLAFLLERWDKTIQEPRELEDIYRRPLLGAVPESAALSQVGQTSGGFWAGLPPAEAEVFNLIRAHLFSFNRERQPHSVLVASATPHDGKTTIACQLAVAAAGMGSRVLLLEADLRQPALAERLGIRRSPGLSDVVTGTVSTAKATQSLGLRMSLNGSARQLDVLVAGHLLPPNPPELIESGAMDSVLQFANSEYDLVVIDTPPLDAVSDAFPLLRKVDGVIIVGWMGRTPRSVSERLQQTLSASNVPLLGVIANGVKPGAADLYGTGGYISREAVDGEAAAASVTSLRRHISPR